MKTQVIKIGNSRGIRILKSLLEQSGLSKEVDIEVREDELIIRSISKPRKDWSEGFLAMAEQKDDILLDINNASLKNRWQQTGSLENMDVKRHQYFPFLSVKDLIERFCSFQ